MEDCFSRQMTQHLLPLAVWDKRTLKNNGEKGGNSNYRLSLYLPKRPHSFSISNPFLPLSLSRQMDLFYFLFSPPSHSVSSPSDHRRRRFNAKELWRRDSLGGKKGSLKPFPPLEFRKGRRARDRGGRDVRTGPIIVRRKIGYWKCSF